MAGRPRGAARRHPRARPARALAHPRHARPPDLRRALPRLPVRAARRGPVPLGLRAVRAHLDAPRATTPRSTARTTSRSGRSRARSASSSPTGPARRRTGRRSCAARRACSRSTAPPRCACARCGRWSAASSRSSRASRWRWRRAGRPAEPAGSAAQLEPRERRLAREQRAPAAPHGDPHPAREVLARAQLGARRAGDRDEQLVRRGRRPRRPRGRPPRPGRAPAHATRRRATATRLRPAGGVMRSTSSPTRATTAVGLTRAPASRIGPPAKATHTGASAERARLPPPPAAGEGAAPVLLHVGRRAVERDRLAAHPRPAADARGEHDRLPVLRQAGHQVREPERAARERHGAARAPPPTARPAPGRPPAGLPPHAAPRTAWDHRRFPTPIPRWSRLGAHAEGAADPPPPARPRRSATSRPDGPPASRAPTAPPARGTRRTGPPRRARESGSAKRQ